MGIASYQHIFSSRCVADFRGMVRDNANDFNSNANSTPIEVFQHNWFREGYFKSAVTIDHGRHRIQVRSRIGQHISEREFQLHHYRSNPIRPGHAAHLQLPGNRPDLEQSAFVQDLIHLENWTVSAGLRWDHYQLLLNVKRSIRASRFPAIFRPPIWCCISPMTGFFRRHRLRTSCFRVPPRLSPSIREFPASAGAAFRRELLRRRD